MNRYVRATIALIVVFAVGLVGFYVFSADMGDGLERTATDGGITENQPMYQAPLDYGSGYSASFLMGIIGFIAVLLCFTAFWFLAKRRGQDRSG